MSMTQRVVDVVLANKFPMTTAEIAGAIGFHVSAAQASTAGRRYQNYEQSRRPERKMSSDELVEVGRKIVVTTAIRSALRLKKICKVRPGVYVAPASFRLMADLGLRGKNA